MQMSVKPHATKTPHTLNLLVALTVPVTPDSAEMDSLARVRKHLEVKRIFYFFVYCICFQK